MLIVWDKSPDRAGEVQVIYQDMRGVTLREYRSNGGLLAEREAYELLGTSATLRHDYSMLLQKMKPFTEGV